MNPLAWLKDWFRFLRGVQGGVRNLIMMEGTPVLVYQMGSVGSMSVTWSLRHAGYADVLHVHRLSLDG